MEMKTELKKKNELLGKSMIPALEKRKFEAYYCPTAKEALEKALSLIPERSLIAWGGSATIRDIGLTKAVHEGNYEVIDRDLAKTPEEMYELHRKGLLCDYYLTSTNAISQDGVLVNVDGTGNRVAAMTFGPKNVIIICGMNKVAPTVDDAIARARGYAAPLNAMRFMGKTPCAVTGSCHNCTSLDCICNQILITRMSKPKNRIKIILVGEEIGF